MYVKCSNCLKREGTQTHWDELFCEECENNWIKEEFIGMLIGLAIIAVAVFIFSLFIRKPLI